MSIRDAKEEFRMRLHTKGNNLPITIYGNSRTLIVLKAHAQQLNFETIPLKMFFGKITQSFASDNNSHNISKQTRRIFAV